MHQSIVTGGRHKDKEQSQIVGKWDQTHTDSSGALVLIHRIIRHHRIASDTKGTERNAALKWIVNFLMKSLLWCCVAVRCVYWKPQKGMQVKDDDDNVIATNAVTCRLLAKPQRTSEVKNASKLLFSSSLYKYHHHCHRKQRKHHHHYCCHNSDRPVKWLKRSRRWKPKFCAQNQTCSSRKDNTKSQKCSKRTKICFYAATQWYWTRSSCCVVLLCIFIISLLYFQLRRVITIFR